MHTHTQVSDASKPYHIVAFEALIKLETKKYLHHYTVYGVTTAACPGSAFGYEKGPLIWPWGPGMRVCVRARSRA